MTSSTPGPGPLALLISLCLATACSGGGWIQLAGQDYDFPPKRVLQGAVAARITGSAVDRLTGIVSELLPLVLDTNEHGWVCLPDADQLLGESGASLPLVLGPFSADVGMRELSLCLDLSDLEVEFIAGSSPAAIRLSVSHARVSFDTPAVISGSVSFGLGVSDAACRIDNELGANDVPHAADVSFVIVATIEVDEDVAFSLSTTTESITIHDIGVTIFEDCSLEECTDPNPGGIGDPCLECAICEPVNFGVDLIEFIDEFLGEALDPLLASIVDLISKLLLDNLLNGRPLDIAARISLSNTLGGLTESVRTASDLGLLMRPAPGGFAVEETDAGSALTVLLQGGTVAAAPHPCVDTSNAILPLSASPFPTLSEPPDGEPWDAVIAISEALLNQGLWSLFEAGGLCLAPNTIEMADLTGGALQLDAALLDFLAPGTVALAGRTASVRLVIRPQFRTDQLPILRIAPPDTDALMRLRLEDTTIALEVYADEDYVRLLTLRAGVQADLKLARTDDGFAFVIDAIDVLSVSIANPGLVEPAKPEDIVELGVEALILLLEKGPLTLPFDPSELSDAFGPLPLTLNLTAVGTLEDDWIAAWFTLDTTAATKPRHREIRIDPADGAWLITVRPSGPDVFVRADGMAWRTLAESGRFDHLVLQRPGNHTIDVLVEGVVMSETVHVP